MRYIIYYHDYFGNFNSLLNFLCSSDGKQQYINVSLIRYKYFFSLMRVRVLVRPFFTFNRSVCVSVCVCVCVRACVRACVCARACVFISALFLLYIFIMVYILFHNLLNFRYN